LRIVLEVGSRVARLLIAFVEVQERVEFRLADQKLLQALLVFERAIRLRPVIGKLFLDAGDPVLLLSGKLV
jgi:hypothetical protein